MGFSRMHQLSTASSQSQQLPLERTQELAKRIQECQQSMQLVASKTTHLCQG